MSVWRASNLKKRAKWPLLSAEGCHTLPELFAGQEGPTDCKGTLRPDFQAFTRHIIFFKDNVITRYRNTVQGNPGIVSL
jgi:hypothetical protein